MKLLEYEDMEVQREYLNQMYRIQMDDIYLARVINQGRREVEVQNKKLYCFHDYADVRFLGGQNDY